MSVKPNSIHLVMLINLICNVKSDSIIGETFHVREAFATYIFYNNCTQNISTLRYIGIKYSQRMEKNTSGATNKECLLSKMFE